MKCKRNRSCIYTGAVGAKLRVPVKRPTRAMNMRAVKLIGGPLAGVKVKLDMDSGTGSLPLAPMKGFSAGQYRMLHFNRATWVPQEQVQLRHGT